MNQSVYSPGQFLILVQKMEKEVEIILCAYIK